MAYQKTTIKLAMRSDKDRSKAMQIAARIHGSVIRVEMQGQDRDHLVVIGEFDAADLTESLRKKFKFVTLVSVQPITSFGSINNNYYQYDQYYHQHQWPYYDTHYYPYGYSVVRDSDPNWCSIM